MKCSGRPENPESFVFLFSIVNLNQHNGKTKGAFDVPFDV